MVTLNRNSVILAVAILIVIGGLFFFATKSEQPTEPLSNATSGNATLSANGTLPAGNGTLPAGNATLPATNATKPSGNATLPAVNATAPVGNATVSGGDVASGKDKTVKEEAGKASAEKASTEKDSEKSAAEKEAEAKAKAEKAEKAAEKAAAKAAEKEAAAKAAAEKAAAEKTEADKEAVEASRWGKGADDDADSAPKGASTPLKSDADKSTESAKSDADKAAADKAAAEKTAAPKPVVTTAAATTRQSKGDPRALGTDPTMLAGLAAHARSKVGIINKNIQPNRSAKQISQQGGQFIARYYYVPEDSISVSYRKTDPGTPFAYAGQVRYRECLFECRGATKEEALNGEFTAVESKPMTEIVRYVGSGWKD